MRSHTFFLVLATLVTATACTRTGANARPTSVPQSVACADASPLRQRAVDDRRKSEASKSDHEKIAVGSRASFFASLATTADLKCKVALAEADEALKPALEAARKAEATSSTYERAQRWNEATFIATEVMALQIQRLLASPRN